MRASTGAAFEYRFCVVTPCAEAQVHTPGAEGQWFRTAFRDPAQFLGAQAAPNQNAMESFCSPPLNLR